MRTEKEILKDFEKLGYKINKCNYAIFIYAPYIEIKIELDLKGYRKKHEINVGEWVSSLLTLKEHKLLHELFKIWGWLE